VGRTEFFNVIVVSSLLVKEINQRSCLIDVLRVCFNKYLMYFTVLYLEKSIN
jgi:hypothetical protein